MIYKKPESEDSDLEYGNVSPVPGVVAKLNSNLKPKKTKEDDGLARMVRMSTIFQSPGFLEDKPRVQPGPVETDYMVCPYHEVRLESRVSKGGWHYLKCPRQPCLIFCSEERGKEYESCTRMCTRTFVTNGKVWFATVINQLPFVKAVLKKTQIVCTLPAALLETSASSSIGLIFP